MTVKFSNNAVGTLSAGITQLSTTITLTGTQGQAFPVASTASGDYFFSTLVDQNTGETEIVKVTSHAANSNVFTVERTAATKRSFSTGATFEHRLTAEALAAMMQPDQAVTITANNTHAGNNTFTGANTFSGNNTFTGTQAFANATVSGTLTNAGRNVDAFPSGTRLLFQQSAPPTGWVRETDTNFNNRALRLIAGSAVTVAPITAAPGAKAFTAIFSGRTIARNNLPDVELTLSINEAGAHTHSVPILKGTVRADGGGGMIALAAPESGYSEGSTTETTASAGAHAHTGKTDYLSGGASAQVSMPFDVAYCDVLIFVKS